MDYWLSVLWGELGEDLSQRGVWSEDRCALRGIVDDVDDGSVRGTVLLEEGGDG